MYDFWVQIDGVSYRASYEVTYEILNRLDDESFYVLLRSASGEEVVMPILPGDVEYVGVWDDDGVTKRETITAVYRDTWDALDALLPDTHDSEFISSWDGMAGL